MTGSGRCSLQYHFSNTRFIMSNNNDNFTNSLLKAFVLSEFIGLIFGAIFCLVVLGGGFLLVLSQTKLPKHNHDTVYVQCNVKVTKVSREQFSYGPPKIIYQTRQMTTSDRPQVFNAFGHRFQESWCNQAPSRDVYIQVSVTHH